MDGSNIFNPVATIIVPTVISKNSGFWSKSIAFRSPHASSHALHPIQYSSKIFGNRGIACGYGTSIAFLGKYVSTISIGHTSRQISTQPTQTSSFINRGFFIIDTSKLPTYPSTFSNSE